MGGKVNPINTLKWTDELVYALRAPVRKGNYFSQVDKVKAEMVKYYDETTGDAATETQSEMKEFSVIFGQNDPEGQATTELTSFYSGDGGSSGWVSILSKEEMKDVLDVETETKN